MMEANSRGVDDLQWDYMVMRNKQLHKT